ncbi:MAG: hypothetical protein ABJZ55_16170 [Fuerstiella sp.]
MKMEIARSLESATALNERLDGTRQFIEALREAIHDDGLAHIRFTGQQLQRLAELINDVADGFAAVTDVCPQPQNIPAVSQKGTLPQWAEMLEG